MRGPYKLGPLSVGSSHVAEIFTFFDGYFPVPELDKEPAKARQALVRAHLWRPKLL